jgi:hypothetical protein
MIVLNLVCGAGHGFEAWFASTDAYDQQAAAGLVSCPHCLNTAIVRLPSAPHVRRSESPMQPEAAVKPGTIEELAKLASDAEDVGQRFPEEARRIHYDEAPARTIRGEASVAEALELLEEGIPVLPAPIPGKKSRH